MKKLISLIILFILCFTFVGCGGENNTVISSSSSSNGIAFQEKCDAIIAAVVLEFYGCEVDGIPEEDKLEVTERTFAEEYEIENYIRVMYQYWDDMPSLERSREENGYIIAGFMIEIDMYQDEENYQKGLDFLINVNEAQVIEAYPYLVGIYEFDKNYCDAIREVILDAEIIP